MDGSEGIAGKPTSGVQPLVLSRQAISTVVVIAVILWVSAIALWMQADLDKSFLISHNGMRTNERVIDIAKVFSKYGMSLLTLVYLIYLLFAFRYEKLRDAYRITLLVLFLFGIAAVGSDLLKVIIARPRPFVTYAGEMIAFSDAETYALPSGHASKSIALALPFIILVAARDRWHSGVKILLGLLTLGVCYSRVVLGAHYVSDVLAGMGWALASFPVATLLTNQILGKMDQERLNVAVKIWALVLLVLMLYLALR